MLGSIREEAAGHEDETAFSVVEVDRDDDVPSVCGKIDTAQHRRVVLLIPRGNAIMEREILGVRLVKRHADQTGRDVAVVTSKGKLAARVRGEGIPVAGGLDGRPVGAVRFTVAGRQAQLPRPRVLAGTFFAVAGLLVAALAGLFWYPSATATVYPSARTVSVPVTIKADPSLDSPDLDAGLVPAQRVHTRLTHTFAVQASGKKRVGTRPATGQVVLINQTDEEMFIPAGTVVATGDGDRYATRNSVQVPAGVEEFGAADIVALEPGSGGNVPAGAITVIEGIPPERLKVANMEPVQGGEDREVRAVTEGDVGRIRAQVAGVLTELGWQRLTEQYGVDAVVPREAVQAVQTDEEFNVQVGDPAEFLTLHVEATATGLAVRNADLEQAVAAVIGPQLGSGEMMLPGGTSATVMGVPAYDAGEEVLTMALTGTGKVMPAVDMDAVKDQLSGSREGAALAYLQDTIPSEQPAAIDMKPGWLPWLPWNSGRIALSFETVQG